MLMIPLGGRRAVCNVGSAFGADGGNRFAAPFLPRIFKEVERGRFSDLSSA